MPQTILTYAPKNRRYGPREPILRQIRRCAPVASRAKRRAQRHASTKTSTASTFPHRLHHFSFYLFFFRFLFRASRLVVMRSVRVFISRRREIIWELPLRGRSCNRRTTDKLDRGSPPTRSVAALAPEAKNRRKERRAPTAQSAVARRRRHRRANLLHTRNSLYPSALYTPNL